MKSDDEIMQDIANEIEEHRKGCATTLWLIIAAIAFIAIVIIAKL